MTQINDEGLLYSKDELTFRDIAKEFVEREIVPIAKKVETGAPYPEYEYGSPHEICTDV